ncbi:hypothetical protein GGU11DRAFT_361557 [Lentinula aff. detonsa]|nr:hypothetical protein GGU11DRAFT_361557 [Lentinula aff. detonsa]
MSFSLHLLSVALLVASSSFLHVSCASLAIPSIFIVIPSTFELISSSKCSIRSCLHSSVLSFHDHSCRIFAMRIILSSSLFWFKRVLPVSFAVVASCTSFVGSMALRLSVKTVPVRFR